MTDMRTVRRYPWSSWFQQSAFVLRRGVDFTCAPSTMAQQVRNAAWRLKIHVSVGETPKGDLRIKRNGNGQAG